MRLFSPVPLLLSAVLVFSPFLAVAQERALEEQSATTNRIALLIGNSKYQQNPPNKALKPLNVLSNPCNDVVRFSAVLERAGWAPGRDIIQLCDATRSQLRDAIDQFKDGYLSAEPSLGFVYYAGHGLQLGNDTYLFGIDSWINLPNAANAAVVHGGGNVFRGGVRLFSDLISQVGDAGSGSIFIVIDACRETPIDSYFRTNPALAAAYLNAQRRYPSPALGIKLFYSTAYGELASDGIGSGSPFGLAFEAQLKKEGRVEPLVSRVIKTVRDDTQNSTIRQIPDTTGALNPPPPEGCLTTCGGSP